MATSPNGSVSPQFAGTRIILELAHMGFWKLISRNFTSQLTMFWRLETGYGEKYFSHSNWQALEIQTFPLEPIIKSLLAHAAWSCPPASRKVRDGHWEIVYANAQRPVLLPTVNRCWVIAPAWVLMDILIPSLWSSHPSTSWVGCTDC